MELTTTPPYPIFIHWIQTTPSPFNLLKYDIKERERGREKEKERARKRTPLYQDFGIP